jgi:hypothetical protein
LFEIIQILCSIEAYSQEEETHNELINKLLDKITGFRKCYGIKLSRVREMRVGVRSWGQVAREGLSDDI